MAFGGTCTIYGHNGRVNAQLEKPAKPEGDV